MSRRSMIRAAAWAGLWVALLLLAAPHTASAQISSVTISIPGFDYDVIYLSDFIDVTSQKLTSNIPGFSGTMAANPAGASGQVYLVMSATMQLQNLPTMLLASATTNPFTLNGSRTISARNLAKGGVGDITVRISTYNDAAKTILEDYIKKFPAAPTGVYTLKLEAHASPGGALLGSIVKEVVIRSSSPNDVVVNLDEPRPYERVPVVYPRFSWNVPYSDVTLFVYELVPGVGIQGSVQGTPCLKRELTGASSFIYPPDANRPLQVGKAYVWFVTALVRTNRGDVQRTSELRVFRVGPPDERLSAFEDFMNNAGGSAGGTIAALLNSGWVPSGNATLNGSPQSTADLVKLLKEILASGSTVTARVE